MQHYFVERNRCKEKTMPLGHSYQASLLHPTDNLMNSFYYKQIHLSLIGNSLTYLYLL